MANGYTRKFSVTHKTKDKVKTDLGAVIEGPYGLSIMFRKGSTLKITRGWDKDLRQEVDLPEPIYINLDDGYVNLNAPMDKPDTGFNASLPAENPIEAKIRSTFSPTPYQPKGKQF